MKSTLFFSTLLTLSLSTLLTTAIEDDVKCLEGIKSSLSDPLARLGAWAFSNTSVAFVCSLVGVSCWNQQESRLLSLQLPSMSLAGTLPSALRFCVSLQNLDLSGNRLAGPIPPQISSWLPYLVSLDLSGNLFSGSIPAEISNCKFLNSLNLNDNQLSGPIPAELGRLDRLKKLSVANNDLSGQIPADLAKFQAEDFGGNNGLCGKPIGAKCGRLSSKSLAIIVIAGVLGAVGSLILGFAIWWWFLRKKKRGFGVGSGTEESNWVERLRPFRLVQVTLFQKPIVKIKLNDLIAATNSFDPENIVVSTRTGVSYRANLDDGSALAIKRLSVCKLSEKQFRSEMNRLGQLRHPNLVPLLGFCVVEDERLLLYKHMPNGTLNSLLHGSGVGVRNGSMLDWSVRVRIGVGAARGLAWLHHGCQPPYLHQNISSNVILVDDDFDARISDFGMPRLVGSVDSNDSSYVNGDLGEFGYVAPEYSSTMVASMKGDVYGFGVVLLELVTGQKALEVSNADEGFKGNLVDWVTQLCGSGRSRDVTDKSLGGKGSDDEIMQFLKVACTCVASRPKDRPSMYNVYQSLKSVGEKHGFSDQFDEFPLYFGKQDH
ncbi:LOW QUALITY PROTEIN: probable inactive receptor kinase At1g27190 [Actinidia eriantha]|uniref:LOW QUALITY PROTEIN: probable inactive receptor kinase At1g27190 n=1 Tax=Actinidia eriantha TaxID=165200 RepID=UPI002584F693|nr:LOW QUALITY PROTEIN: probable inactive receptor kinase At1g27190 [Actinidia eriantha]